MAEETRPNPIEQITIQDFDNVVRIIDVCCQRGAVRGEELTAIGSVREKFSAAVQKFIADQQAAQQAQGEQAAEAPAEANGADETVKLELSDIGETVN